MTLATRRPSESELAWLSNEGESGTIPAVLLKPKGRSLPRCRRPGVEGCSGRPLPRLGAPRPGPHVPGCARAAGLRSSGPAHLGLRQPEFAQLPAAAGK